MKKILWLLLFFIGVSCVSAKETYLTKVEEPNVYYAMYNEDMYRSYPFYRYYQDGIRVYCIDPDQIIETDIYEEVSDVDLYSEEVLQKIRWIQYFGSDYPGHNTLSYELATQALIWEEIKGVTVRWFTERYSYGEEIDVEYERGEILRLMEEFRRKPLFEKESYEGFLQDHLSISDFYHVLGEYEISSFDGGTAYIENDEIKLLLETVGDYTLVLKRKMYDTETKYYIAPHSQTMMKGRIEEEKIFLPIHVEGREVEIQKYGITIEEDKIPLSGVSFELRSGETIYYQDGTIRYHKDEFIDLYETNENGRISLLLPEGHYYLKETKTEEGFEKEEKLIPFTVQEEKVLVEVENYEPYGSIKIQKTDSITGKSLKGVKYRILNLETKDFYEATTDENGIILLEKLRYGTYQMEEIESLPNYILDTSIKIVEIKEQKEYEFSYVNEPVPEIPDTESYEVFFDFSFLSYAYYEKKYCLCFASF